MRFVSLSLLLSLATGPAGMAQEGPQGMEDPPRYVEGEESEALESLRRAEEAMFERRQALVEDRAGLTCRFAGMPRWFDTWSISARTRAVAR